MPPIESRELSIRSRIKRHMSMENLRGSDGGRPEDDSEYIRNSDCDEIAAKSKYLV